jgi:hypothetical protein
MYLVITGRNQNYIQDQIKNRMRLVLYKQYSLFISESVRFPTAMKNLNVKLNTTTGVIQMKNGKNI